MSFFDDIFSRKKDPPKKSAKRPKQDPIKKPTQTKKSSQAVSSISKSNANLSSKAHSSGQLKPSKSTPDISAPFPKPSTSHARREGILEIAPRRSSRNLNLPKPHAIIPLVASTSVNHNNNVVVHVEKTETNHVSDFAIDEANVTFRKVQGTNKNDQAGDDLSRSSSITNLSDTKNKGASSKIKKSASKDRLDKIVDKKNDKKGLTKNNNKIEDTPTYSTESLQEIESLQRQLQEMANEKTSLALQLGEQKGQCHVLENEMLNLKTLHEQLNQENNLLRNRLKDVAHSPLSDNEKQQLLLESHRHHSSAPASIATNLIEDASAGDVTACPTPDWDKHSSSNVSEISVACLQDRINQMEETHYSTKEELQATVQELNDLQRQLTELQQDNYQLLEEKNLMFDSLCRQTERLNESKNEIETLKQRLREKEDDTGQYESAIEHEQKLLALLKDAQAEREILLMKQEQLTNELQEALNQNTQQVTLIEQLNERVKTLESTLDAKHAEHKQLEQEVVVLKDQSSGMQIEIDRLSDQLENARTKIVELEQDRALSDKSELDELLDNSRKEKDALESEVTNLKEQVARSKNESEKLKDQVSILQEECKVTRNNAKCTQSELEYKCEILTADKNTLNEQLIQLQEAANGLQMQAQCQLEDKRQLSTVLSETQKLLSEAERRNEELESELEDLKKLRREENEEWEKFQNDLLTSVRVANDFKTEAQQDLQKMILENKAHREKVRHLEAQIDKLKGEDEEEDAQLPPPPVPQIFLKEKKNSSQQNEVEYTEVESLPPPPIEIIESQGKESSESKEETTELDSGANISKTAENLEQTSSKSKSADLPEDVDLRQSPKSKSPRPGSTKSFFKKPKIFRNHKGYYVSDPNSLENSDSGCPSLSEQGPQSLEPVDLSLVSPPPAQATSRAPIEIIQLPVADKIEDKLSNEMDTKSRKKGKQKVETSGTVGNKVEVRKSKKDSAQGPSSKQHLSSQEQKDLKSLNELYIQIDPNIPEEFMTPEQKFIVKLKQTYDSTFERTKTKPIANKPKNSLAISKPLLTSVISNPKLKQIADDPTVRVVEDDATKNLYNTSNVFYPAPQPTTSARFDDIQASSIQFSYYNAEDTRRTTESFKPDGTLPKSKSLNDLYFKKEDDLNKIANYPYTRQHSTGSLTNFASTSRPSTLNPVVRRPESIASTFSDSGASETSLTSIANITNKNQGNLGQTLDELSLKIDPNVPDSELTNEQKFVKQMKLSMDEMGRKSALRKESKRNVVISEPTKESVWNNPKLASVIKDSNTPEVKVEQQKENKIKKLFGIFKAKKEDSPPPPKKNFPKRQISQEDIVHVIPPVDVPKKQKESKQKSEAVNLPKHKSESNLVNPKSEIDHGNKSKSKGNLTKQKSESNLIQSKLASEMNLTKPKSDMDLIQEAREPMVMEASESTSSLFKSVITNSDLQKLIENRNSPDIRSHPKKAYENEDNSSFNSDLYEDPEIDDFTCPKSYKPDTTADPYASDTTSSTTSSKKEVIHRISSIPPTESFNTFVKQKISPSTPKVVFDYDDLNTNNPVNARGNLRISIGFDSLDSDENKLDKSIENEAKSRSRSKESKLDTPKDFNQGKDPQVTPEANQDSHESSDQTADEEIEPITRKPKPNQEYFEKLLRNRITTTPEYLAANQPNQVGLNQLSGQDQVSENKKSHLFIKNAPKYKKQVSSPLRPPPPPPIAPRPKSEVLLRKKESVLEPPQSKDDQNYFSFSFKFEEPIPTRSSDQSNIPDHKDSHLTKRNQNIETTPTPDAISSESTTMQPKEVESQKRDSFLDLNFKFQEPITSVSVRIEEKKLEDDTLPLEVERIEYQSSGDDQQFKGVKPKLENQEPSIEARGEDIGSFEIESKICENNEKENVNAENLQDLIEPELKILENISPQAIENKSDDSQGDILANTQAEDEELIANHRKLIGDAKIDPANDLELKPNDQEPSEETTITSTSLEDVQDLENENIMVQKHEDAVPIVEEDLKVEDNQKDEQYIDANSNQNLNDQNKELGTSLDNQNDTLSTDNVECEDFGVIEPPPMFIGDNLKEKDEEPASKSLEHPGIIDDIPISLPGPSKIETDETPKDQDNLKDSETNIKAQDKETIASELETTPITVKNEEILAPKEGDGTSGSKQDLLTVAAIQDEVIIQSQDLDVLEDNSQELSRETEQSPQENPLKEEQLNQRPEIMVIAEDTKQLIQEENTTNNFKETQSITQEENVEIVQKTDDKTNNSGNYIEISTTIEEITSGSLTIYQDRVEIRQSSSLLKVNNKDNDPATDFERDSLHSNTSFSAEIDDTDPNFGSILNTKSKCSRQSSVSSEEEIFRRLSYKLDNHELSFLRDVYKKYEVDRPKSPINDTDIAVIERAKLNSLSPEFEDTPLTFDIPINLDSDVFLEDLRKDCQTVENDDDNDELTPTEMELIQRIKSTAEDRPVSEINEQDLKIIDTIRQETLNRKSRKISGNISPEITEEAGVQPRNLIQTDESIEDDAGNSEGNDEIEQKDVKMIPEDFNQKSEDPVQTEDVETGEIDAQIAEASISIEESEKPTEEMDKLTSEDIRKEIMNLEKQINLLIHADDHETNTTNKDDISSAIPEKAAPKNDYLENLLSANMSKKSKVPPVRKEKPPLLKVSQRSEGNQSEDLFDFLRKPTPKKIEILKSDNKEPQSGDETDFVKNIEARTKPLMPLEQPDPPKTVTSSRTNKITRKSSLIETLLDDDDPNLPQYSISSWVKRTTPKRTSVNEAIKARQSFFLQNQDTPKVQIQKMKPRDSWKSLDEIRSAPKLSLDSQNPQVLKSKDLTKSLDEIGMLPASNEGSEGAPIKIKAKITNFEPFRTTSTKDLNQSRSDEDFSRKIFAKYEGTSSGIVRTSSMTSDLFRSPRMEQRSRGVYKSNSIGGRSDPSLNFARPRSVEPTLSVFKSEGNFSAPERTPSPMGYEPIYANYKELQSPKKPLLFKVGKPPIPSPRYDPSKFKIDSSKDAFDNSSGQLKMDDPKDPKRDESPASIVAKDRDKDIFMNTVELDQLKKKSDLNSEENGSSSSGTKPKKSDDNSIPKSVNNLPGKTSSMEILYDSEESGGISEKSSVDKSYLELFKSPEQIVYENLSEPDKNKPKTTFTTLHFFKSGDISSESSNASTQDEAQESPSNKVSFLRKKFEQSQKKETPVTEETVVASPIEKTQSIPANHVLKNAPKAANLPQNIVGEKQTNHGLSSANSSLENLRKSGRQSFENARSVFEVKVKKQESITGQETISETTDNDEAQIEDNNASNDQMVL